MGKSLFLCLALVGAFAAELWADEFLLRDELAGTVGSAQADIPANVKEVAGRLPRRKAVHLQDSCIRWEIEAEGEYFIEYWLRPVGWDGVADEEVEVCRFTIGATSYRLYKAADISELLLESDGRVLQSYPVYDWIEQQWMRRDERVRWHYLNIAVSGQELELRVDGFQASAAAAASVNGRLQEFTLCGGPGTSFSELRIIAGAISGEDLRARYRDMYSGQPSLHMPTVTVPWVEVQPDLDGRISQEQYAEMATITGFNASGGEGARAFDAAAITGFIGYNHENLFLALETPYEGELRARHWGRRDMPLYSEESYEIFVCPPWTGTADYVQLVGNPYSDQTDLRNISLEWDGRWYWEADISDGKWTGELKMPFAGVEMPSPGDHDIWSMNIFNTQARAAWSPARAYHDHKSFGVLRFDRHAPVIRPGNIAHDGSTFKIPLTIIGRGPQRTLTAGLQIFGPDDMLPARSTADVLQVADGERIEAVLELTAADISAGILVMYVQEGDTYLYYRPGRFPFAEVAVRAGMPSPASQEDAPNAGHAKAETDDSKELSEEEKAYTRTWSAEELGNELLNMPQWYNRGIGVSEEVMSPWTPMRADDREIHCWGRIYRYENTIFPAQIISVEEEHLSAAPHLVLVQDGKVHIARSGSVEIEKLSDGLVRAVSKGPAGPFQVQLLSEYEFDGMVKMTMTISHPEGAAVIEEAELVIPLVNSKAQFYHYTASFSGHPPGTDSGAVPAAGLQLNRFRELVWLGDMRSGICWFAESTENWKLRHEEGIQVIEKSAADDAAHLRIRFANRPFSLDDEWQLVFGIQATPTRPRKENFRLQSDWSTISWNWFWGDGQYYPFHANAQPAKEHVETERQRGREVMPCSSILFYGMRRFYESRFGKIEDPGLTHKEIMLWQPLWRQVRGRTADSYLPVIPEKHTADGKWYGQKYMPKGLTRLCANSPFQDYYLWRLQQLIDETGLGAIYLDQPIGACSNSAHGCGYINWQGEWSGNVRIFAMREMMKRMRRIFHDAHGDARIKWHSSNQMMIPVISFIDNFWDGENYLHGPQKVYEFYSKVLPEDRMLAQHTGVQFGFAPHLLPEFRGQYAPSRASVRDMLGMFWVYDGNVSPIHTPYNALVSYLQNKRLSYGLDDMEVVYYWQDNDLIETDTDNVKFILHHDSEQALLILFNWSDDVASANLRINSGRLFAGGDGLLMQDALNNEKIMNREAVYNIRIAPRDLRLLEITAKH